MSYTATTRLVQKLGLEAQKNREVHVHEIGESYDVAAEANTTYSDGLAAFPYTYEI